MALTKVSTPAIKDEAITLAKLLHGDSNSNGKFLRANNGADPSFETIDLTALSASNLTSGTLPDARFPATLPAVSAANLTNIPAANITGTLPAIDGSNLTGITSTTINNNADNRVITGGSGTTLNGESNLTFDGGNLVSKGDNGITIEATSTNTAGQLTIIGVNNSNNVSAITRIKSVSTDSSSAATATTFSNRNSSNAVNEHMRIDSSGNVGIGTSSPAQILHLNKSSGDTYLRLQGGTNQGTLIHATDGTLLGGFVSGGAVGGGASDIAMRVESGNNMLFAHGTTERMRIDSSGRVGIGTSSPTDKFHVVGTTLLGGNTYLTSNTYISSNKGIYFDGGSSSANYLDDYEEGTFTIVAGSGSSVTFNSSNNKGSYTKIGRQVTIAGQLRINSGSGNVRIALPFTAASNTEDEDMNFCGPVIGYDYNAQNGSDCDGLFLLIDHGNNYARFMEHRDNNPWTSLDGDAGAYLRFTLTYFVA